MSSTSRVNILDVLHELLSATAVSDADFIGPGHGSIGRPAHSKVVGAIRTRWLESKGFEMAPAPYSPPGGTYGIDFLGRESERGRIILAVEVDAWKTPIGSWQKLADIRASYKAWVYVTKSPRAGDEFMESLQELGHFLRLREETEESLGKFVAFLKTPTETDKKPVDFRQSVT